MPSIEALLHDPNRGVSRRVTLIRDPAGALVAVADDVAQPIPLGEARLDTGGFNAEVVHLIWEESGAVWSLSVRGDEALGALAEVLTPRLGGELARARGTHARGLTRNRLGFAGCAALMALPVVALLGLFLARGQVLDAVVERLPESLDQRIGDAVLAQMRASGRLVASGPEVDAVGAIGKRVAPPPGSTPFAFRFEVVNDPSINAFAAPGGLVVVHSGLIAAAESPEEVAGVLAHEVTHVLRRHSLRQIVHDAGVVSAISLVVGDPGSLVAGLAGRLSQLGFSRDQERDADRGALEKLRAARLPADGMLRFFDRLRGEEGAGPAAPAWLMSHPATEERVAALRGEIAAAGAWPVEPLTLDWEAARAQARGALTSGATPSPGP